MPKYRYEAVNQYGEPSRRETYATDVDSLRTRLKYMGMQLIHCEEIAEKRGSIELSDADFAAVATTVAHASAAQLPIIPGLAALAEESSSVRFRKLLHSICDDMTAGASLEDSLQKRSPGMPRHLLKLFSAGQRTGQLPLVLERHLASQRRTTELRSKLWLSLAYPLVVVFSLGVYMYLALAWLVPQFSDIFTGFGTELPSATVALISLSDLLRFYGSYVLLTLGGLFAALVFVWMRYKRSAFLQGCVRLLPVAGPMSRLTALAEFADLFAQLLECRVPQAEALALAGEGSSDLEVAQSCQRIADEVQQGVPLSEAALSTPRVPLLLRQLLRWSDRPREYAEALYAAADMCGSRAGLQIVILSPMLEACLVPLAAVTVGTLYLLLTLPMIKLLNDLA